MFSGVKDGKGVLTDPYPCVVSTYIPGTVAKIEQFFCDVVPRASNKSKLCQ